jgi:hypothetical protein
MIIAKPDLQIDPFVRGKGILNGVTDDYHARLLAVAAS